MWGASTSSRASPTACAQFQVVPPCGGHQAISRIYQRKVWFQVVPPCGGHLDTNDLPELQQKFQVVPPCGGHHHASLQRATAAGFKSCPRVGGIRASDCIWLPYKVSSRAPVWGASRPVSRRLDDGQFQVVPPCGGHPPTVLGRKSPIRCFKSCPRVGGIQKPSHKRRQPPGFKSCPRVGGIALISSVPSRLAVFQVVPPCGGHQLVAAVFTFISSFKSCPRVGGILDLLSQDLRTRVSSRAPVWGASGAILPRVPLREVSSRAPVWGASQARSTHH